MITSKEDLTTVLVTDCGSTTTKALLFEKTKSGWRQTFRGEAPTTVEKPVADVTVGALNAFKEIEELSGRSILKDKDFKTPAQKKEGIDLYLSTSSAGGGLQMLVCGVVKHITTESAERAALGAGGIVLDAVSADDGREDFERVEKIRHLKPDIVLLCGGVDGGSTVHVIEMAETILAAAPRPRFGNTLQLPVIYAGNKNVAKEVEEILSEIAKVLMVENLRPTVDKENLGPAREAIHEFFLSHVMSHSPGYNKLLAWSPVPVMPTPAAVGDIMRTYAEKNNLNTLCVDIGGATTDVFSVFKNKVGEFIFNRTVSANLGMSYSIANVLIEAGVENISRWLPSDVKDSEVKDRLRNKMIRPSSIPQTKNDLWLEQSVCREALRLSLEHHKSLAVGLSGVTQQRGIASIFSQTSNRYELVDQMKLDMVIGSGGVLSHAPERLGAALMMIDGFSLMGLTEIAVDSIFMMPHLGVLSSVHPEAAEEIFLNDCMVRICHSIVPVYKEKATKKLNLARVFVNHKEVGIVIKNKIQRVDIPEGQVCEIRVEPLQKSVDLGNGQGEKISKTITVAEYGLILDGRNRPIRNTKNELQNEIYKELGLL